MDRRIKKTKAAIQEAYFSLLLEKGTPKITITELADRANIDRKTFYLHYSSVDDIVKEAMEDQLEKLMTILEEQDYLSHPFEFEKVFESINVLLKQDLPFYRLIAKSSLLRSFWAQFQEILSQTMIDVYKDISPVPLEELEIYAKFCSAGIIAVYSDWLTSTKSVPIEQLGQIAGKLIGKGVPEWVK
jgi:AcrR family transcriptional regulator